MTTDRSFLLKLTAAALIMRVLCLVVFGGVNYYAGISEGYIALLQNVLDGRGFVAHVDIAPASAAQAHWSYEPFIERPLGYPLLLLPFFALTRSLFVLQLVQALLATAGAVLVWRIGQHLTTERAARIGALMYALWPLSARFDIVLLPDAVMSPMLLASLWLLLRGLRSSAPTMLFLASGLVCGAAMTVRADVVLLPGAIGVGLFLSREWRLAARGIIALAFGAGLVIGAHAWRNYEATKGEFVPLAIGGGISVWEGISQFGDTLGTIYGDVRTVEREGWRSWAYPDGVARDRKRMTEAAKIILDNPAFYATVMLKRIPVVLKPDGIVTGHFMPAPAEYFSNTGRTWRSYVREYTVPFVSQILLVVAQGGALILALAGFRPRRNRDLWIPMAIIAYYLLIHIVTNAEARYFYPAMPLVLLMAAGGVEQFFLRRKEPAS